jgi:beta-lactam-binding protein with PASTA domain
MLIEEILENYKQVWARTGSGVKRKYRCTSGQKKGRVVAKPSTCGTGIKQKQSVRTKKTRRLQAPKQSIRRGMTVKRPTTKRVTRLNKIRPRKRSRK